ncbi:transglycosylase SLT domain-containing protein [Methylobacterium organophilum]|uniref:Transglycosylase SLT domain-containing protein n=1 Tax=Methylobacterium organophilum TaxID=410 RepID=A0ABQ4T9H3_METOR|nr:transglycosylase SLT domain-containing protein [Methylobacterium organophilum]GJE26707.1 hypothetical protein LKMONMHP_1558 [Methylobacterium organophilum]
MFLFTNTSPATAQRDAGASAGTGRAASASTGAADGTVLAAIRDGAQNTGVGFDYLLATAQRESSLNPAAKAATSSATGLFQFIEQTWLGVMKNAGPKLGLGSYADAITARSDGTYTVSDPTTRQAILDLRRDPKVSATMAGALTQKNREALLDALGREPTSGDLYAAHVLGAKGAATLIADAQAVPERAAALDLPEAAASNRSLFYDRSGRPRGAAELYATLANATAGVTSPVTGPDTATGAGVPTAYASLEGGIRALFQTDRRQGAISDGVAKLWQSRNPALPAAPAAPTWFPRSEEGEASTGPAEATATTAPAAAAAPADGAPILIPLPPRRPEGLTPTAPAAALAARAATPAPPGAIATNAALFDVSSYKLRNGP